MRERFFTPRLRVKSLDELNAALLAKCVAYAKAHRHVQEADETIWEVFEAERPHLVPYVGRFDGFHSLPAFRVRGHGVGLVRAGRADRAPRRPGTDPVLSCPMLS